MDSAQWLAAYNTRLTRMAENAQIAQASLRRTGSWAASPHGEVEVHVGPSGALTDLRLTAAARALEADRLAQLILATARQAQVSSPMPWRTPRPGPTTPSPLPRPPWTACGPISRRPRTTTRTLTNTTPPTSAESRPDDQQRARRPPGDHQGRPLSAVAKAGFGFVTQFVRFLEEPLHQLRGDRARSRPPRRVAGTLQTVTRLISEAAGQIITVLTQAFASAARPSAPASRPRSRRWSRSRRGTRGRSPRPCRPCWPAHRTWSASSSPSCRASRPPNSSSRSSRSTWGPRGSGSGWLRPVAAASVR